MAEKPGAKKMAKLRHIAIIMDGNGRWAKERKLPRSKGHEEGLKVAKAIVKSSAERNIPYLSLYVFSTENWKRIKQETDFLMGLVHKHLKKEFRFYRENNIRFLHSGEISGLPKEIQQDIRDTKQETKSHNGLVLNLAINYGGRDEILRAFQRYLASGRKGPLKEEEVRDYLDCPQIPDPDLIIRTAGEMRLSNFLLWQSAYSEFVFFEKYWPDFTASDLDKALSIFRSRERRFGAVKED